MKPSPKLNRQLIAKFGLKVGDMVKVTRYRPGRYPPGVKDDLRTEALFKRMVGKSYRIRGFDEYGHIELRPKRLSFVWIEPDLVEPVPRPERSLRRG